MQLVAQHPNEFDLLGFMFYSDFSYNYSDEARKAKIVETIDTAVGMGIPASKLLIGATTDHLNEPHSTPDVYVDVYNQLRAKYPDLRGLFHWETLIDRDNNWAFVNLARGAVG